jgi:hypothetical protein
MTFIDFASLDRRTRIKIRTDVASDRQLSSSCKRLYQCFAAILQRRKKKPFLCFGQEDIAHDLGMSMSTVRRCLERLHQAQLIHFEPGTRYDWDRVWLLDRRNFANSPRSASDDISLAHYFEFVDLGRYEHIERRRGLRRRTAAARQM